MSYRHTQIGWVTLLVVVAMGIFIYLATTSEPDLTPKLPYLILVIPLFFSTLTTEVENRQLTVFFGPGIIRRTIDLGEVREVRVVQNSWLSGWGIRWTGTGWMWNVSGLQAIELEYKEGERFRIGTDEPEKLAAAVRQHLDRRR